MRNGLSYDWTSLSHELTSVRRRVEETAFFCRVTTRQSHSKIIARRYRRSSVRAWDVFEYFFLFFLFHSVVRPKK
jgi:hypothetical protein